MSKLKKLTVLLCALVVLCAATFALTQYEEEQEQIRNSDSIILEVSPEAVQTFSWEYGEESLSFRKNEDGLWLWEEDDAFPVDQGAVTELLETFQEFGVAFIIEEVTDYSQYGLEEPECTIHFSTADTDYTVCLGGFSKMDSQRYVSIGDDSAYLVSTDPLEDFQVTIRDMIRHDTIPVYDQATKIKLEGLVGYSISYEEDSDKSYCAEDVYFTGDLPLDTSLVESYLRSLTNLKLTDYVTYNATAEELTSFGMDQPELTITLDYLYLSEESEESADSFSLHVSRDPVAAAEVEAAAATEETEGSDAGEIEVRCFVRLGDSPIVYEITQSQYDTLTKAAYNDLRHKELLPADFEDITQIDITLAGETYTFSTTLETVSEDGETEVVEAEDDEIHWYYLGEEISISGIESAVFNLFADSFTEEEPSDMEEISAVFHLNNERFPTVTIQLYRYDGSDCLAVVDGEPVALIDRVYAVDLVEATLAIVLN